MDSKEMDEVMAELEEKTQLKMLLLSLRDSLGATESRIQYNQNLVSRIEKLLLDGGE